ncbi:MAG TPA: hypothetical protein VN653_10350 [Anaerolineales bacterium]|nr:hypothetical protein [Anaerolineales bacterium]
MKEKESEAQMAEKTTRRKPFEAEIPEEVRQHVRAAREELRESIKAFLPPEFMEHRKKARKEMLLAWRSVIDTALERMEEKGKKA